MKLAFVAAGCFFVILTLLSLVRSARWWIRFTDFPRLQIAVGLATVLSAWLWQYGWNGTFDRLFLLVLAAALVYQCLRILPYTILSPRQTVAAKSGNTSASVRLLISNVLMENRRADAFLAVVRKTSPDLVLAVETDHWWDEQLHALDCEFPNAVRQPQDNTYGMHLFSRLELGSPEILYLVEDDVPSVHTAVRLRSGEWIDFHGVHPRPPEPRRDTEERDAEILIVARKVKAGDRPTIVAGDLNDVAWSNTTRLFQRISGTFDPRRGRGMFSTFHAKYPFFRWPLDHVFHNPHFALVSLERHRIAGSDHFLVFVELRHEHGAEKKADAPAADQSDREEAGEKVARGRKAAASRDDALNVSTSSPPSSPSRPEAPRKSRR